MDYGFEEIQEMLRKDARRFLTDRCPKSFVREMEEDVQGFDRALWKEMADLGWMGLVFPEEYGGQGMSFLDLAALLEEMGRACLPGPYFSTVILGGLPILEAGSKEQKQEFLPKISDGEMIMTMALLEQKGTYDPAGIATMAKAEGDHYVVNGTKLFVSNAHVADYLICAARTESKGDPSHGVSLFLVDAKSPGISCTLLKTIASDRQCEVKLENVSVPKKNLLGELNQGWALIEKILMLAAAAECVEMVGGAQQVLEMVVSYTKERVQFDVPIGSFQAIQHHCANMAIDVDASRFITYEACWAISQGLPCDEKVSMAKAWVSDAYRRVVALGQQIHGGIGFTRDHDMQLYFRRAKVGEVLFGDGDYHREKLVELLAL
ncbi:MAG: acyl-CoA/acyl-ACP dehydrogenase [Dehalococcoidia bacterium]|nr:acyl-CoA/acyl-ACP dehydrogenase [Dehalococcoidia bacterium]